MCSLRILANANISSTMFNFENCFFLKKSKYHVCVILSRLCDTLNVMDVQVSHRRDTLIWLVGMYFHGYSSHILQKHVLFHLLMYRLS